MTASTERTSPLGDWAGRFASASADPAQFAIRERAWTAQINLRGNPADPAFGAAVRGVLGADLPARANTWTGSAGQSAIWLGPDEWLLTGPEGTHAALESALRAALRGQHHSVVDISANRTIIEIGGALARSVLLKGCSLDLHTGAFAPPQSAQTVLAKAQVLMQCCAADGGPVEFRLYVRNSFAHYLAEWLTDAAAESLAARTLDSDRIAARLR